jgi:hypothetical protein
VGANVDVQVDILVFDLTKSRLEAVEEDTMICMSMKVLDKESWLKALGEDVLFQERGDKVQFAVLEVESLRAIPALDDLDRNPFTCIAVKPPM